MDHKIRDAFKQVTADDQLKAETEAQVMQYLQTNVKKQDGQKLWKNKQVRLGLVLIVLFGFIGSFIYSQPVSAVSIDTSSSVDVYLNRFNRVVDVVHYDENGQPSTQEADYENKSFEGTMEEILNAADTDEIYVTVASQNERDAEEIVTYLNSHEEMMYKMHVYQTSADTMQEARRQGMSMGRMHAMHQIEEYDETYQPSEMEKESTQEIMEIMDRYHKEMMRDGHMKHHRNHMRKRR